MPRYVMLGNLAPRTSDLGNRTGDFQRVTCSDTAAAIQQYLKGLNGQGTVPHIYIKQEVSSARGQRERRVAESGRAGWKTGELW